MISLQTSKQVLSEESLTKKRKMDDPTENCDDQKPKDSQFGSRKPVFNSEWQRCLDIKSGQIYFYNTRTNKRVQGDSSSGLEQPEFSTGAPMSLELGLNLSSQSWGRAHSSRRQEISDSMTSNTVREDHKRLARSPSWLTFEGEEHEMVTAVCKKCYMLVMMCKSSPSCPNCKFLHPSEAELT
ncbi:protein CURLY FLAG LEAF 1-like [Andrographis paniculata]|uniref:protein CURLY FLAG LEAF 1-like n=1 Tax=Andrographis paniculata TaxID=175694 RepID=UPI0021E780F0|nr:protein CURLY FLAG LEAF 1-like [Andrographis paniculata]